MIIAGRSSLSLMLLSIQSKLSLVLMFCDFETKGTIANRDPRTRSQYLLLSIWIVRFSMERFKDLQVFHNALPRMIEGNKGTRRGLNNKHLAPSSSSYGASSLSACLSCCCCRALHCCQALFTWLFPLCFF